MTRTSTVTPSQPAPNAQDELNQLIEQRDALPAQIKTAKAAQKAAKATEVALSGYVVRRLSARTRALVAAGQSQADALEQVLTLYRDAVITALAGATDEDAASA